MYDVCHAYRPGSEWVSQYGSSINNKRKDITGADLLSIGELIASKKAALIIYEINETVASWNTFAKAVDADTKLRNNIAKTHWVVVD